MATEFGAGVFPGAVEPLVTVSFRSDGRCCPLARVGEVGSIDRVAGEEGGETLQQLDNAGVLTELFHLLTVEMAWAVEQHQRWVTQLTRTELLDDI